MHDIYKGPDFFLEGVDGQVAGLIETKIDCIQHEFESLFIQGNNFAGVYDSFDMLSQLLSTIMISLHLEVFGRAAG